MNYLESPGNMKRYSFGENPETMFGGMDLASLPNIDRNKKLMDLTWEFLIELYEDLNLIVNEVADNKRCKGIEHRTERICRKKAGHDKHHVFIAKGTISLSTINKLIKS